MHITILLTLSISPAEAKLPVYVGEMHTYTLSPQGRTQRNIFLLTCSLRLCFFFKLLVNLGSGCVIFDEVFGGGGILPLKRGIFILIFRVRTV